MSRIWSSSTILGPSPPEGKRGERKKFAERWGRSECTDQDVDVGVERTDFWESSDQEIDALPIDETCNADNGD